MTCACLNVGFGMKMRLVNVSFTKKEKNLFLNSLRSNLFIADSWTLSIDLSNMHSSLSFFSDDKNTFYFINNLSYFHLTLVAQFVSNINDKLIMIVTNFCMNLTEKMTTRERQKYPHLKYILEILFEWLI